MATKKQPTLKVTGNPGDSDASIMARVATKPTVQAALTIGKWWGDLGLEETVVALAAQVDAVKSGNMANLEGMLVAQAFALDGVAGALFRRAHLNAGEHLGATETYLRLALKAQSQCRATIQVLAELKNPRPVAFIAQANVAHGPQQINNGIVRAGEIESAPSQLLETHHEQRLVPGTTGEAIGGHPEMATLGEINRTTD